LIGSKRIGQKGSASQVHGIAPELLVGRAGHEEDRKVEPARSKLPGQINPRHGAKLNIEHQACRFRRSCGGEELGSMGLPWRANPPRAVNAEIGGTSAARLVILCQRIVGQG
jgi:hypothetical protein